MDQSRRRDLTKGWYFERIRYVAHRTLTTEFKNKVFWSKQQCCISIKVSIIYQSSRWNLAHAAEDKILGLPPSWPSRPCRQLLSPTPKNLILLVFIPRSSSWMQSSRTLWAHRKPGVQSHWRIVLQSEGSSRYLLILLFHRQVNNCIEGWIRENEPRDTFGIDSSDGTVRNDPFPCESLSLYFWKPCFSRTWWNTWFSRSGKPLVGYR